MAVGSRSLDQVVMVVVGAGRRVAFVRQVYCAAVLWRCCLKHTHTHR